MAIGTLEGAHRALAGDLDQIGAGANRRAYYDREDRCVYKVGHIWSSDVHDQVLDPECLGNIHEAQRAHELRAEAEDDACEWATVRYVPEADLIQVRDTWGGMINVLAMEYIPGPTLGDLDDAPSPEAGLIMDADVDFFGEMAMNLVDLHMGNLKQMKDGRIAVIDLGCG